MYGYFGQGYSDLRRGDAFFFGRSFTSWFNRKAIKNTNDKLQNKRRIKSSY